MPTGKPRIELDPATPGAFPQMDPNDPSIVKAVKDNMCRHCENKRGSFNVLCSKCGRCERCGCSPYCATRML